MYNLRMKCFKNGSLQLTYYHSSIQTKEDKYKLLSDFDNFDYLRQQENNLIEDLYNNNPFLNDNDDLADFKLLKNEGAKLSIDSDSDVRSEKYLISSLNRSKKMIYDYGRSNVWEWFFTFTFKENSNFDRTDYETCKKKMLQWLDNTRKKHCPNMKYLVVPEQHKDGAWHFHGLFSDVEEQNDNKKGLTFNVAINNQKWKKKNGEIVYNKKGLPVPNKYFGKELRTSYPDGDYIYNIAQFKNGFTTATKIKDTRKAVTYITKYITKDLCSNSFRKRRYFPSNNLDLPNITYSLMDNCAIDKLISKIEYYYNVQLSIDAIKTYQVDVPGYKNSISVFEFSDQNFNDLTQIDSNKFWSEFINDEYLQIIVPKSKTEQTC